MKVNLIGKSFDMDSGQGIYRYSGQIFEELKAEKVDVVLNESGDINHVQQPELIWKALFKKNVITTVHDIMPFFISERKWVFNLFFKISILLSLWKSKKIIAVSKSTKKDILKYFNVNPKKISVVYEGVSEKFYPIKRDKNKILTFGYVGGLGKRKNIEFILKLANKFPKLNFKIGGKGPDRERLEKISKRRGLTNVEFVGFIPESKMNDFYNSLDFFIFPSFYEGFGLPVVEAMACGIPCIVSDRGSLPEITYGVGLIIDIDKIEKSNLEIIGLIKDIKKIKILKDKSIKRANDFKWRKCAMEILKIYKGFLE
jgi:glycosyltransferase involved in cell wall biosynthesis